MQVMFTTFTSPPATTDFARWAKHGNQFYENMQRLEHNQRNTTQLQMKPPHQNPFGHIHYQQPKPHPPVRNPDAMELDAIHSVTGPADRLNTLTPEERAWCIANDACLRCRQCGHMKRDCPNARGCNNGANYNGINYSKNNSGGQYNDHGLNYNQGNGRDGNNWMGYGSGNYNYDNRNNSPGRRNASPSRGRRNSSDNLRRMEAQNQDQF